MATEVQRLTAALENRYRVVREIGRGGMATVYLAAVWRRPGGPRRRCLVR